MILRFVAWRRGVIWRSIFVTPVKQEEGGYFSSGEPSGPLTWTSTWRAFGKIDNVKLSGSFLIEFKFEQEELRNWVREFVHSDPEAAIKILSEMQGEALICLIRQIEERLAQREAGPTGLSPTGGPMTHAFTLTLANEDVLTPEISDRLHEAGINGADTLVLSRGGSVLVRVERQADKLADAIASAINQVEQAGYRVAHVAIDS